MRASVFIDIDPGLEVEPGATFVAYLATPPCINPVSYLSVIYLETSSESNAEEMLPQSSTVVSPNPSQGNFVLRYSLIEKASGHDCNL